MSSLLLSTTSSSVEKIERSFVYWTRPGILLVRIHDYVYDVTDFRLKHPGGSVLTNFLNQDVTEAFEAFHLRSVLAKKVLRTLPSIPIDQYFEYMRSSAQGEADNQHSELTTASSYTSPTAKLSSTTSSVSPPSASLPRIPPAVVTTGATRPPSDGDRDVHDSFVSADKSARTQTILKNFRRFRDELQVEGFFDPSLTHVAIRVLEVFLWFYLHFYLVSISASYNYDSRSYSIHWLTLVTAVVVGGLAGGRSGWLQHEGGHASLTGRLKVDKFIQKIGISFGLVCFNGKWNNMHNKHHALPQMEDCDPDVDTLPFLAVYEQSLFRGRRRHMLKYMGWWIKYQHLTFLVFTSVINVFFWHLFLHPREYLFRKFDGTTLALVVLRYCIHLFVAVPLFGIFGALLLLLATLFVTGVYLFGNFSLSHTYMPTVEKHIHKNWVDQQLNHTMNIDTSFLVNWWMGYLNCQIEHHLFPDMPQHKQPLIAERTKQFCEHNGIEYAKISYFSAVKAMLSNLREVACRVDVYREFFCKENAPVVHPPIDNSSTTIMSNKVEEELPRRRQVVEETRKDGVEEVCKMNREVVEDGGIFGG